MQDQKKLIEQAWEDRKLLEYNEYIIAIESVIERLDKVLHGLTSFSHCKLTFMQCNGVIDVIATKGNIVIISYVMDCICTYPFVNRRLTSLAKRSGK